MDANKAPDARQGKRRWIWLSLVGLVIVVCSAVVTWHLTAGSTNAQETADSTAEAIADAMTAGENAALVALFCPRDPGHPPAPEVMISSPTPVVVNYVDQQKQAAMVILNHQHSKDRSFGALLVQGDDENWCVFGFRTCPRDVKVTSATFVTVCRT